MPNITPSVRVLLVDDDPDDQFLIVDLLQQLDIPGRFSVDTVCTYEEALAQLRRPEHDVVLVDYQLGAYTGADLLRETANDFNRPPLVILTGHSHKEIDQRCLAAGAADFIVKSTINAESLGRSLRYVLERHRLRNLLVKRERDYRELFDVSPVAMWIYDLDDLSFLEVNDAAIRQYGLTRNEFLTRRMSDLTDSSDHKKLHTFRRPFGEDNTNNYLGIWRHRGSGGKPIDVEISCSDIRFGNMQARLALVNDITAKLRIEESLRASAAMLRQVLRDTADGLLVVGNDNIILFANPVAGRILGHSEEHLIGQTVPERLCAAGLDTVSFTDSKGILHLIDVRIGETHWDGGTARVLTLHDVTEQRHSARKLALLSKAVDAANDGLLVFDARQDSFPIIYINPAFERITGYRAHEVMGRNLTFLNGEDRNQAGLADIDIALKSQHDCVVELRQYRKDGSLFWSRLTLSPVREDGSSVSHFVVALADISEQKRLEAEHHHLATYDVVTGLPKYWASGARIEEIMEGARSEVATGTGRRLAFLFIDLENFKSINYTMGYSIGDAALRHVALRLRSIAGPDAEVLRYAGDEFVVLLGGIAGDADLLTLAYTYCEGLAEPLTISTRTTLFLTASVGLAAFPDTGSTALELTRHAEIANNRAKRGGRNGAFVFGHELHEALGDRVAMGGRMREALTKSEFFLQYQPQVNAQDGALTTVEALVRWNSPEFGLLPPRRFVPVAEDSGMIFQLGAWILRTACRQLRSWMDQGLNGFVVSVNISAAQIQRPTFINDVRQTILETGIDPRRLELELTESVVMGNADHAVAQMHDLKRLGLRLVLDDFGMGYSSLSYLRRFPIDKLKIDQSFITHIVQEGNDAALVRAMIALGHHLGLRVVAEGVESAAQLGYLRRAHCDEIQGHYFARALSAEEIPALVQKHYLLPSGLSEDAEQRTLLILDDDENIRRSLTRLLRRDGYQILAASCATEAFELLAMHRAQVILSDQRMPGMSGTEFLSQVKEMYPDTVRMVLSGFTDLASVTEAINRGAIYKFLTKPWDDEALRAQVLEAFRRYELAELV